ncbi:vitamin K epoxide reductase family protein [Sinomicrobium sp. M5D2P9]
MLQLLKVNYTSKYVEDSILSHSDYPSLLSVSDTLDKYDIEHLALKTNGKRLEALPKPCVVQITQQGSHQFYVVESIDEKEITYYDENNKLRKDWYDRFLTGWTGVCLAVQTSETTQEPGIEDKLKEKRIKNLLFVLFSIALISWFVADGIMPDHNTFQIVVPGVYVLLKLLGVSVSVILLWYGIDKYNPTLQHLCSGGTKISCDVVMNSRYSKILGTDIDLNIMAFAYFFASLMLMLITAWSSSSLGVLSILSFMTAPVILFSVYAQAFVLKKWCKFCLMISGILAVEIGVALFGEFYANNISLRDVSVFLVFFSTSLLGWKFLKPFLERDKEINFYKRSLKKIKNNQVVLQSLLSKSRKITNDTDNLGILLKNSAPKYQIIKVCNPYCGPCAKAHPVLDKLYKEGSIDLQIIFTARADNNDRKAKPVSHFLAIESKGDIEVVTTSLDRWYTAEQKDYEAFARQYPMNGELEQQWDRIRQMSDWCKAEKITHTPTIFINGYELPKEYNVADLQEVLGR